MKQTSRVRHPSRGLVAALALCGALAAGCAAGPAPAGFAAYRGGPLRSVSPEGVIYQVETVKNKPKADLAFWAESVRRRQENAGYRVVSEAAIEGAMPGVLIELEAPLGPADYSYLIAVFVDGRKLRVVQASGEVGAFALRREAVVEAIAAMAAAP